MDKYKCIIWGTELCDGEVVRRELLAGINDSSVDTLYKKYKKRGCENIFFLKYGIECGYSSHVREVKDDQFEVYNPQAGGMYRTKYVHFLHKNAFNNEEKTRLSGWIAKENLRGNTPPTIELVIKDKDSLEMLPPIPNPGEKADLLLKGLITLYPEMGQPISLNVNKISHQRNNPTPFLYSLSYCSNSEEFHFLLFDILKEELGYIKIESSFTGDVTNIKVTSKGWNRFKEIESKNSKENSKTVFIAMWFNPSMDDFKEEIKKGIKQAGYEPLRIDEKEYNNKIDDEILFEIDQSNFIICDLTSELGKPRGNVYFEAGYAKKAKSNEFIIWTCSEQLKNEIAFDVGGYNFIFWYRDEQGNFWVQDGNKKISLKDKIQKRIESVVYKYKKLEKGVQRYEENTI